MGGFSRDPTKPHTYQGSNHQCAPQAAGLQPVWQESSEPAKRRGALPLACPQGERSGQQGVGSQLAPFPGWSKSWSLGSV